MPRSISTRRLTSLLVFGSLVFALSLGVSGRYAPPAEAGVKQRLIKDLWQSDVFNGRYSQYQYLALRVKGRRIVTMEGFIWVPCFNFNTGEYMLPEYLYFKERPRILIGRNGGFKDSGRGQKNRLAWTLQGKFTKLRRGKWRRVHGRIFVREFVSFGAWRHCGTEKRFSRGDCCYREG